MSNISQALRMRAGNTGAFSAESDVSSLLQYGREDRVTALRPTPPAPKDRPADDRERPPAPARAIEHPVRPPAAHDAPAPPGAPHKVASHVDAQARLVTGTSSTVSIEQYRKLAATLHDAQMESQLKTVMITSALPGEGKTLTAVNLALTLSESYARRVLVIDADLRGPSMHDAFAVSNTRGLGEALHDGGELTFVPVSERLVVLPAGTPGPAPLAGLTSARMAEIVKECSARFDWVLIDTPPIGVLTDAQVLARLVGAVLLVVGAGTTPADAVERAVAELGGSEAIFGLVLNRVEQRRIPSAHYYGHYKAARAR
jgi:capsular exopolysaccharide synthesis family protein